VATVFLLLAGENRAYAMLERVALHHLRYPYVVFASACVCVLCECVRVYSSTCVQC
jgi:hypothetical protein